MGNATGCTPGAHDNGTITDCVPCSAGSFCLGGTFPDADLTTCGNPGSQAQGAKTETECTEAPCTDDLYMCPGNSLNKDNATGCTPGAHDNGTITDCVPCSAGSFC